MCGVVGYFAQDWFPEYKTIVYDLFRESKVRGLHSFGIAYYRDDNSIGVIKEFRLDDAIKRLELAGDMGRLPSRFIFHNRYATSGDWRNHENNQPIVIGDSAIAFDGVLDMGTKAEMEARHGEMDSDNDAEIALRAEDQRRFLIETKGSFAGLILQNGRQCAFRNERRPLWYYDYGCLRLYASTRDIFKRALKVRAEKVEANIFHEIRS